MKRKLLRLETLERREVLSAAGLTTALAHVLPNPNTGHAVLVLTALSTGQTPPAASVNASANAGQGLSVALQHATDAVANDRAIAVLTALGNNLPLPPHP